MHKRLIAAGGQHCGCIFKSLSIVANVQQLQLFIHLNRKLCSVSIENRDMKSCEDLMMYSESEHDETDHEIWSLE